MNEDVFYRCYYTKEYPVDEFGRPGGFYSLADLPVVGYDRLSRKGIIEAKNSDDGLKYKVRDVENNRVEWIPENDVQIGEIHEGDQHDWTKWKENYE